MFFEIQHTDKDYYKKMAGVYVKVNEAIGQTYLDYYCKDTEILPADGVDEFKPIEKLVLWLK